MSRLHHSWYEDKDPEYQEDQEEKLKAWQVEAAKKLTDLKAEHPDLIGDTNYDNTIPVIDADSLLENINATDEYRTQNIEKALDDIFYNRKKESVRDDPLAKLMCLSNHMDSSHSCKTPA